MLFSVVFLSYLPAQYSVTDFPQAVVPSQRRSCIFLCSDKTTLKPPSPFLPHLSVSLSSVVSFVCRRAIFSLRTNLGWWSSHRLHILSQILVLLFIYSVPLFSSHYPAPTMCASHSNFPLPIPLLSASEDKLFFRQRTVSLFGHVKLPHTTETSLGLPRHCWRLTPPFELQLTAVLYVRSFPYSPEPIVGHICSQSYLAE